MLQPSQAAVHFGRHGGIQAMSTTHQTEGIRFLRRLKVSNASELAPLDGVQIV